MAQFPATAPPRAAAQMLMVSAGVTTAWIQTCRASSTSWRPGRFAPLRKTAGHLRGARSRATADLSGLLEGIGMIVVLLLYAGPVLVAAAADARLRDRPGY